MKKERRGSETIIYSLRFLSPVKTKHHSFSYLVFALVLLVLSVLTFFFQGLADIISPSHLRELLASTGPWGYVLLILIITASVPLPLPSVAFVLAGGYVYGLWIGSLLSLVGITLGSLFSFLLIRKLGEPVLEKMVDRHHLVHFNHVFQRRGLSAALISYAIPVFPSDAVSMFLGLTQTRVRAFLTIVILGHIPRILLVSVLGRDLQAGFSGRTFLVLGVSVLFLLVALFREQLKKVFFKELQELEKEAEKVEKEVEEEVEAVEEEMGMKNRLKKRRV